MSTFTRDTYDILKRAKMSSHERFLADEKRKKNRKTIPGNFRKKAKTT